MIGYYFDADFGNWLPEDEPYEDEEDRFGDCIDAEYDRKIEFELTEKFV